MPRVIRSPLANNELAEIWEFIAIDKVDAADRLIIKLDETFQLLASSPFIGRARPEIAEQVLSGGQLSYTLPTDGRRREIVRVVHGQRDLKRIRLE